MWNWTRSNRPEESECSECYDVYCFDQTTFSHLQNIPVSGPGEALRVNILKIEPSSRYPSWRADWISLGLSATKILEMIALWKAQAHVIWWVSGIPWLYFFISAGLLHQQRLSRGCVNDLKHNSVDVIAGQLPVPLRAGGERKVLLGVPQDFRRSSLWKAVWACGSIVCTASLVTIYVSLATSESTAMYIWLGFQLCWLVLRSVYFHFSQESKKGSFPVLIEEHLHSMNFTARKRLLNLWIALSRYQVHNHPRSFSSYEDELSAQGSVEAMSTWIHDYLSPHLDIEVLENENQKLEEVDFVSVIGDAYLSSAAWLHGSKLTGMDLYDSCIVVVAYDGRTFAVPAARVYGAISRNKIDVEEGRLPLHPPKGSYNWSPDQDQWIYWIPCSSSRWLEVRTQNMKVIGKRKFELVTDSDITKRLNNGTISVSHSDVAQIREVVKFSNLAYEILLDFFTTVPRNK